jgi:UDP-GlcNAc:undecaprenyl-phosphate GlcNAc-1-phosphate transferase
MNTYLLIFVIALVSSLLFTPLVRRSCERFGWFDEPKDLRRVHRAAIPRLGGVVIFLSLTTALITGHAIAVGRRPAPDGRACSGHFDLYPGRD